MFRLPRRLLLAPLVLAAAGFLASCVASAAKSDPPATAVDPDLTTRQHLGRLLFSEPLLSGTQDISCASCHAPDRAFGGNNGSTTGVARGSGGALGIRNTPSAMYASFAPAFAVIDGTPTGGQFLDGRVDTLAQQAMLPLVSANEMNNTVAGVVAGVQASAFAAEFQAEFGADIFTRPADAFAAIALALQDFQQSARFHPFSSRYDEYLRGHDTLNRSERRGMALFFDPVKGNCAGCHAADPRNPDPGASLFTDFTYDNLGVPRNNDIAENLAPAPPGGTRFFDLGLGGPKRATLPGGDASLNGAFKVPTLRNVAVKEAFMHNGRFKDLAEVVAFYVTRDTDPDRWYPVGQKFDDLPPGDQGNVNTSEVPYDRHPGEAPHLNAAEIADVYNFLRTLTDADFEGQLPPPIASN